MRPIEINSVIETYNDRVVVRDYITKNFDDGTKVRSVEVKTYDIALYGSSGQLQDHTSKGNVIDDMI